MAKLETKPTTHDALCAQAADYMRKLYGDSAEITVEFPIAYDWKWCYADVLVVNEHVAFVVEVKTANEHNRIGAALRELHMQGEWIMRQKPHLDSLYRELWIEGPVTGAEQTLLRHAAFTLTVYIVGPTGVASKPWQCGG